MRKNPIDLYHQWQFSVNNKSCFLFPVYLVALFACFATLLIGNGIDFANNGNPRQEQVLSHKLHANIPLAFEDDTRSYQNVVSPFSRSQSNVDYQWVEKFQSCITKVSLKYLIRFQYLKNKEEHLFLDLRRLLI